MQHELKAIKTDPPPGEPHRGGDIMFRTGCGWSDGTPCPSELDGDFLFVFGSDADKAAAVLKITREGFFVRGEKVADGREVFDAFREWLRTASYKVDPGAKWEGASE